MRRRALAWLVPLTVFGASCAPDRPATHAAAIVDDWREYLRRAQWPLRRAPPPYLLNEANEALTAFAADYKEYPELLDCEGEAEETREGIERDALIFANGLCDPRSSAANYDSVARAEIATLTSLFSSNYVTCQDIFSDPLFVRALKLIDPASAEELVAAFRHLGMGFDPRVLDLVQLAMVTVFDRVNRLVYSSYEDGTLYGCTGPAAGGHGYDVFVYPAACQAADIYKFDIAKISPATRVQFIVAHEMGHVIDELAGEVHNPSAYRETRATVYGSFFIECRARVRMFSAASELNAILKTPPEYLPEERRFRSHEDPKDTYCDLRRAYDLSVVLTLAHEDYHWIAPDTSSADTFAAAFACGASAAASQDVVLGACKTVATDARFHALDAFPLDSH